MVFRRFVRKLQDQIDKMYCITRITVLLKLDGDLCTASSNVKKTPCLSKGVFSVL